MKKLISMLFVVGALMLSFYFLNEIDWEDNKGSVKQTVETITDAVQQSVTDTSAMLKQELDQVQMNKWIDTSLSMNESSAEAVKHNTKLSTKAPEDIVTFLAEQFDYRHPSMTFHIQGSYDDISENLKDWLNEALYKNEYARYALASYSYTVTNKLLYTEVELNTVFRESLEMTDQVKKFAEELIVTMDLERYDQAQQVKLIHDWIVTHVQYDQSLTRYTAYEAITEGLAVCQGYAMLGYMLYSEAGFDVRIVEGTGKGEEHAWNMILLDGTWYHLDLTWDDPVGQEKDDVSYRYYLVSDEQLKKDHSWQGNYPVAATSYSEVLEKQLTELSSTSQEYKQIAALRQQLDFHWLDDSSTISTQSELEQKFKHAVANREQKIEFRYVLGSTVKEDIDNALRAQKVGMSYELSYYEFSDQGDVIVTLMIKYTQ